MKSLTLSYGLVMIAALVLGAEPKPITVEAGQDFRISLASNPSSGNQWLIAKPLDERVLKLLGTEFKRGRPMPDGSTGHEILSFKALSEGKTRIHLKYGRLWERDVAPVRITNFVVVVTRK